MYADDIKLFAKIESIDDCFNFQNDLNMFGEWTIRNKLLLNVTKCHVISFSKCTAVQKVDYFIYGTPLNRVDFILDLGIIFTSDLNFNRHIDYIINRANKMVGFIKRNSKDFIDPLTLKLLFNSYVRSILEYASPVWSPYYAVHVDRIESIQKQFLIFALRRLPSNLPESYILPPYVNRCKLLGMEPLAVRRKIALIMFARDIIYQRIDCMYLLSLVSFYAPQRT